MAMQRDKDTGKPLPVNKRKRRKLSKAALELQRKAYTMLREELESGKQGKRTLADCCREFGLTYSAIMARMAREDWSTPDRIEKRTVDIIAEASRHGGKIYRPSGLSKTDRLARDKITDETIEIEVIRGEAPGEKTPEAGTPKRKGSKRNLLSFNDIPGGNSSVTPGSGGKQTVVRDNFSNKDTKEKAVTPSKSTDYELGDTAQREHDGRLARLSFQALREFEESGRKLPISKLGDFKVIDDLYRRSTGQTGKEGQRSNMVQVNVLASCSREAVRVETSETSELPEE